MPSRSKKSYATLQWENEGGSMRPPAIEAEIGHKLAAEDNDLQGLRCWHEWQIEGHQKRFVLCVETELEMRPGEPGFDPAALEALVLRANEMTRSCPSPIDSVRIVPARRYG